MNKKILVELKKLHEQRGIVTKSQLEYARTEIRALKDICPIIKPHEERRRSNCRTLASYVAIGW